MFDLVTESEKFKSKTDSLKLTWSSQLEATEARIKELKDVLASNEAKGDRSENAVFQSAKDEYDMKVETQKILTEMLNALNDYFLFKYTPTGEITIGSTVELEVLSIDDVPCNGIRQKYFCFQVVPAELGQASVGFLSVKTSVGNALLGHMVDDIIEVTATAGCIKYKIKGVY